MLNNPVTTKELKYKLLSESTKQVILGTILGDSCLWRYPTGRLELRAWHGSKQKDYLFWKYAQLQEVIGKSIPRTGTTLYNGKTSTHYKFTTTYHPFLTDIYRFVYNSKRRKIITRKYLNLMGPQAIAVWWCDDGSNWSKKTGCGSRQGGLSTCCFTWDENIVIARWFKKVWGIAPRVKWLKGKNRSYPYLYFDTINLKRLIKLIRPSMPPSMLYKIDLEYDDISSYNVEYLPTKSIVQTVSR